MKRYAAIADAKITDVMDWDEGETRVKNSDELTWEQSYSITEFEQNESIKETEGGKELVLNRRKKIKQADKLKALDSLARHLGMFNDKLKLSGDEENPIDLNVNVKDLPIDSLMQGIKGLTMGDDE